ncbi:MAG: hypothetical protein BAJALOKI1v1_390006 [Promethearchaeota archaeon]|nr:MAG: hypothetical protein BAJALOKI1v1_390006 [Candidatus Lokiarchaeota archaeon]
MINLIYYNLSSTQLYNLNLFVANDTHLRAQAGVGEFQVNE